MYDSKAVYVVEKRHSDGSLDMIAPQPDRLYITVDGMFRLWFVEHPKARTGIGPDAVIAWYTEQTGFSLRLKTW